MIGLKRYIRPGIAVSVVAHISILIVGPLLIGANALQPPPPPDAMVVEIVTPEDMPRFSGTPSTRRSSGTEISSPSNGPNPVSQSPPPRPPAQQAQQQKQQPTPPDAKMASAQGPTPSETENQSSEQQAESAQAQPEQTPEQANAEAMAKYALAGGPLGGGFPLPPVDALQAAYDYTAAFRERVTDCSRQRSDFADDDKVTVKIRVSFNRDGSLAGVPRMVGPAPSAKQQALFERAVAALEKCQPYTMLPPERYKQWKTLVLDIFPMNFFR